MAEITSLSIAILVFLASAAAVIFFGTRLAVYGDALATLTGWGRLFVGSILIAMATSLPELATNISAVQLDPPNPELAVGNVFGANMLNMFTFAAVALAFGGKRFLQRVAPQQGYLIVVAALITGLALIFGATQFGVSAFQIGLSSVILLGVFLAGMYWVYLTRPSGGDEGSEDPGMTLRHAWVLFLLVSAGVVVAGFFLAWSTDRIAEITGVASSTLGILLVSLVTTMPEAAATIAAARIGAMDLGVAGLYGSCAFNITILFYADIFYRGGILGLQTEPAHFVAGGMAIGLMLVGFVLIMFREKIRAAMAAGLLSLMAAGYIAAAIAVVTLGAAGSEETEASSPSTRPGEDA